MNRNKLICSSVFASLLASGVALGNSSQLKVQTIDESQIKVDSVPLSEVPSGNLSSQGVQSGNSFYLCNDSAYNPIDVAVGYLSGGVNRSIGWYVTASGACSRVTGLSGQVYTYAHHFNRKVYWEGVWSFCVDGSNAFSLNNYVCSGAPVGSPFVFRYFHYAGDLNNGNVTFRLGN
jgi:Protein of unknown function (DUF1036)